MYNRMKKLICLFAMTLALLPLGASQAKYFECDTQSMELGYKLHASLKLDGYAAFIIIDCEWSDPTYRNQPVDDTINGWSSEQVLLFKFMDAEGNCLHYSTQPLTFDLFIDENGDVRRRRLTYDDSFLPAVADKIDHVEMLVLTRPAGYVAIVPEVTIPEALHGLWFSEDMGYIWITEHDIVIGDSSFLSQLLTPDYHHISYRYTNVFPTLDFSSTDNTFTIEVDMLRLSPYCVYSFSVEDHADNMTVTVTDDRGRVRSQEAPRVL